MFDKNGYYRKTRFEKIWEPIHNFFFVETNIIRTFGYLALISEAALFVGLIYVAFHFIGKYW